MNDDIAKWKKRLGRKGPFYLVDTKKFESSVWDYSTNPPTKTPVNYNRYWVIWNDGPKTKFGTLEDGMFIRYGISTHTVLNGETVFDLWNGSSLGQDNFNMMLEVRHHTSNLPIFSLDTLVDLRR